MTNSELIKIAKSALQSILDNPYDKQDTVYVVAAVEALSGKVYLGTNIDWWHSNCAEAVAIGSAYVAGERKLKKIVAVTKNEKGKIDVTTPCGICRQMFAIHAPDIKVVIKSNQKLVERTVNQLLPEAYREVKK